MRRAIGQSIRRVSTSTRSTPSSTKIRQSNQKVRKSSTCTNNVSLPTKRITSKLDRIQRNSMIKDITKRALSVEVSSCRFASFSDSMDDDIEGQQDDDGTCYIFAVSSKLGYSYHNTIKRIINASFSNYETCVTNIEGRRMAWITNESSSIDSDLVESVENGSFAREFEDYAKEQGFEGLERIGDFNLSLYFSDDDDDKLQEYVLDYSESYFDF